MEYSWLDQEFHMGFDLGMYTDHSELESLIY